VIVLDTTILLYAAGDDHPLRDPCRRVFAAVTDGRLSATSTPAVVQEFAHVRARRRDRGEAAAVARHFATVLAPLLGSTERELEPALALFESNPALDAFDSFLAAAAIGAGATAIVSADCAFADVPGIRHVDPGTPELDALLR
jgi:hypothetical protein